LTVGMQTERPQWGGPELVAAGKKNTLAHVGRDTVKGHIKNGGIT